MGFFCFYKFFELASIAGHVGIIDALIANGAKVTLRNKTSHTALMLAAKNGQLSTVKKLLLNGGNPKRRNSAGENSIMLAKMEKHNDVAKFMEANSSKGSLFNVF